MPHLIVDHLHFEFIYLFVKDPFVSNNSEVYSSFPFIASKHPNFKITLKSRLVWECPNNLNFI